ncbi:hypothetical protein AVEN_63657-1 [Araneus ventricosus]|uniref:Uncharacterized protein n=1 Tax=Araneus ventricosus TaxID=182803 RepID=A0A4Y2S5N0_ARAVE|nr:hypothetical protein AVEN_63657-1 [Araneus ventricosus]
MMWCGSFEREFHLSCPSVHMNTEGRSGLVVRLRIRVPGSKPDSTEDPPCMWPCFTLNHMYEAKRPPASVLRKLGERSVVLVI